MNSRTHARIATVMIDHIMGRSRYSLPISRRAAIDKITAILKGIGWRAPRKSATDLIDGKYCNRAALESSRS